MNSFELLDCMGINNETPKIKIIEVNSNIIFGKVSKTLKKKMFLSNFVMSVKNLSFTSFSF